MSRRVEWRGRLFGSGLFDMATLDPLPDSCPRCGGLGLVAESIDEERFDVAVACPQCRIYCKSCDKWVERPYYLRNSNQGRVV